MGVVHWYGVGGRHARFSGAVASTNESPCAPQVSQQAPGVFGACVPEVGGPASHDLIEPDQHVSEWLPRQPAGQGTGLALQGPGWARDDSASVTGQSIVVDGGLHRV